MLDFDRRTIMLGGSSILLMTALGGCEKLKEKIANRPVRRDVANLAANDPVLEAYRDAIGQMQGLGAADPRNWIQQANIHLNFCPHGNWFFLPWHRGYLMAIDSIVRKLTGEAGWSMPYWNWTCQRAIPAPFWQAGSVLNFSPRSATSSSMANISIVGPANLATIMAESDFELFASGAATALRGGGGFQGLLEQGPHNYIHGFVGGTMGTYSSPRDPIFWLHHCNIDRIWFDWNSAGNANSNDPTYSNFQLSGMFVDGDSNPLSYQVGALILAPLLSYRYEAPAGCAPKIKRLDDAALKALLEKGSSARFRTLATLPPVATNLRVTPATAARQRFRVAPDALRAEMEKAADARLVLRLDDVKPGDTTESFFVRVYLNLPSDTAPSPDLPNYAGAFAFFVDDGHDHGPVNYMVDLSETIARLRGAGQADPAGAADVSFELVPLRDDDAAKAAAARSVLAVGAVVPQLIARAPEPGAAPPEKRQ